MKRKTIKAINARIKRASKLATICQLWNEGEALEIALGMEDELSYRNNTIASRNSEPLFLEYWAMDKTHCLDLFEKDENGWRITERNDQGTLWDSVLDDKALVALFQQGVAAETEKEKKIIRQEIADELDREVEVAAVVYPKYFGF